MTIHDGQFLASPILTHRVHFQPGARVWGHNHPHGTISITLSGRARYTFGTPSLEDELDVGDLLISPPDVPQQYEVPNSGPGWDVIYSLFTVRPNLSELMSFDKRLHGCMQFNIKDHSIRRRIHRAFRSNLYFSRSDLPEREAFQFNGIEEVLLWARLDQAPSIRTLDPRVRKALTVIRMNLASPFSLDELAHRCSTSRSRLAAVFAEQIGTPPMKYWERCRLDRAMELLALSSHSVQQVAEAVGYASASHFTERFRLHAGATPAAFRRTTDQAKANHRSPPD